MRTGLVSYVLCAAAALSTAAYVRAAPQMISGVWRWHARSWGGPDGARVRTVRVDRGGFLDAQDPAPPLSA
jgi:hypothetical protein